MAQPAPPFYRSRKAGGSRHRVRPAAPTGGRNQNNACCAPLSVTNRVGERVFFQDRSVTVTAPGLNFG